MTWLAFALIGLTIWSATAIADRYFLLRVKSPRFYLLLPTLLQLPLMCLALLFVTLQPTSTTTIAIAIGSGLLEAGILYFLFKAIRSEEVSRVFPLSGFGTILTLVAGWLLWGDTLTSTQFLALGLFMTGGILLSLKGGSGRIRISKALPPLLISSVLTTAFLLSLRYTIVESDFWTGFFYSRIGFFIAGAILLIAYWRESLREVRVMSAGLRTGLLLNQVVAFSGHIFYFFALSLTNAALVQSTHGIQSGIIFVMALVVSFFNPKLLNESVRARDMAQKVVGIILATLAMYILSAS